MVEKEKMRLLLLNPKEPKENILVNLFVVVIFTVFIF